MQCSVRLNDTSSVRAQLCSPLTMRRCNWAGVHNVNVGQGIKASGVWFRFDGNRSRLNHSSHAMMANLDAAFGLPTGMYNGGACKDVFFFFFWAAAF